jgi:prevent-host-death family protein
MTRVSVTQLKANLSRYLRVVRRGGEVQILDRGTPVARLIGVGGAAAGAEDERRARLLRSGILSPGSGNSAKVLDTPPLRLPTSLSAALEEDRADRL